MQRFKSSDRPPDFLFARSFIHGHFHPGRHRPAANIYSVVRSEPFKIWAQEMCTLDAA